jgi:serine protease AprX
VSITIAQNRFRSPAALLAAGLAALLLLVPGLSAAPRTTAPAVPMIVVGHDAAATARTVQAVGGTVHTLLDAVGGVAADLTGREQRAVESTGLRVVPDAPATLTSTGFDRNGELVQVASLHPSTSSNADAGAGVGVALLDTGVTPSDVLGDRVVAAIDLTGDDDGVDHYGHGTFMAGLIVGPETGVAPAAHLVSVKIAGADGVTNLSTVLEGFDVVVETRDEFDTRVLSLSLGVDAIGPWYLDPLALAVEYATANGVLVVTAAGNEAGTVTSPGISPSALTVGATDHRDTARLGDDVVTPWSGSAGAKPEVVAPGEAIISLRAPGSTIDVANPGARIGDDRFRGSGTSMATALTAGAAAVIGEQAPDATPSELKSMLVRGARPLGTDRAVDLRGAEKLAEDEVVVPDAPVVSDGTPITWAGTRWAGTRWAGTRWAGTRWAGTRWAGTRWAGTRWAGTRWAGTRWAGTRWAGTRWAGTRWAGTRWAAASFDAGDDT